MCVQGVVAQGKCSLVVKFPRLAPLVGQKKGIVWGGHDNKSI